MLAIPALIGLFHLATGACGSNSVSEAKCNDCSSQGKETWSCITGANINKGPACVPPGGIEGQVADACNALYFTATGWPKSVRAPCNGLQDTGGDTGGADQTCVGWNPSSRVTLSGGVRHVSRTFVDQLAASPFALTECDSARVEPQSSGGYKVVGASSATLLYQLGLRNNDVILKLNGQTLNSLTEAASRYADLYLTGNVSSYTLQIRRNGVVQNLAYAVDS